MDANLNDDASIPWLHCKFHKWMRAREKAKEGLWGVPSFVFVFCNYEVGQMHPETCDSLHVHGHGASSYASKQNAA